MKWRMTDIENFVSMSDRPTIMEAARKLEISQPALSESLKRLESDVGTQLFYRSRSGIQLTPSGHAFLRKAKNLIEKIRELDFVPTNGSIFNGQSISIGCHPTVAQYSIPKALRILEKDAPDFNVDLRHDLSRNIQAAIQRGIIDVGVVINPVRVPDIKILKIANDVIGVWQRHGRLPTSIICNTSLFQTQSILKKWKDKPSRIISTESLELICRIVHEGCGFGILPHRVVKLSNLALEHIPSLPVYRDEICIVFRPEFGRSQSEKLVLNALKKSLEG